MQVITRILYFLAILIFSFNAIAQDTLTLNRAQCEAIFLKENLQLLSEKLQIPKAEAMVLQAKLWPNPTIGVEEFNLWATERQLSVFGEELQGFGGGSFGKNQQIGLTIEQLILTAGKRKKLVSVEEVNVQMAHQYFEDVLRNLKIEFRNSLTALQHLQFSRSVYQQQINSITQLTKAYQKQVEQGNVSKGEYIRLRALELEFSKNINDLNKEINTIQKELKLMMRLPANTRLVLTDEDYTRDTQELKNITLDNLLNSSKESRPDLKIAQLEQNYYSNLFKYEKAQRTPDVTLKGGYDRGGNFMYNFVGFGLEMDLPVFNRNQGNVKYAQLSMDQAKLVYDQKELEIENEVSLVYQNLVASIQFFESIEPDYESSLDDMLQNYTKNFVNRNMNLIAYLDFLEAYIENKKIILDTSKEINEQIEELNFVIGKDLIK